MAKVVFEEEQRFNQWWLILLLVLAILVIVRSLIKVIDAGPLNGEAMIVLFLGLVPALIVCLIILLLRLKTRIDENGISAVFSPLGFSKKKYSWNEIETAEVLKYSPLKDYGGWGYRISFRGKKAMNVKGNMGIQLTLKNGKQFLIGTQRPHDAKQAIQNFYSN